MAAFLQRVRGAIQALFSATWVQTGSTLGGYSALDPRRKIIDPLALKQSANRQTANQLLASGLPGLRGYARSLERNNATARAAVEALVGLVVGSGIALEPDLDPERDGVTAEEIKALSKAWAEWCACCGTDGSDLYELQRRAMRDVPVAGEALWRLVKDPSALPGSVPLRVLPLESEWLLDTSATQTQEHPVPGVRVDKLGRVVAYYIAAPDNSGKQDSAEEVPAKEILHIFERKRSMQLRGESWFAPVIETLMNERDLIDAELKAANMTAAMAIAIESENHGPLDTSENGTTDDPAESLKVGSVVRLYPGEKAAALSHTRPSQQIAPFRQMLRGDFAAAMRLPQRFLDRNINGANYSSMRADMLDTERLLGPVREWLGHQTAGTVYKRILPMLALAAGLRKAPPARYRLLPDGQPYVDPSKDIAAATAAIAAGLSTEEAEITKRGGDPVQLAAQRQREKIAKAMAEIEALQEIQKKINEVNKATPGMDLQWAQVATIGGASTAPGAYLAAATANQQATTSEPAAETEAPPKETELRIVKKLHRDRNGDVRAIETERVRA